MAWEEHASSTNREQGKDSTVHPRAVRQECHSLSICDPFIDNTAPNFFLIITMCSSEMQKSIIKIHCTYIQVNKVTVIRVIPGVSQIIKGCAIVWKTFTNSIQTLPRLRWRVVRYFDFTMDIPVPLCFSL